MNFYDIMLAEKLGGGGGITYEAATEDDYPTWAG